MKAGWDNMIQRGNDPTILRCNDSTTPIHEVTR